MCKAVMTFACKEVHQILACLSAEVAGLTTVLPCMFGWAAESLNSAVACRCGVKRQLIATPCSIHYHYFGLRSVLLVHGAYHEVCMLSPATHVTLHLG